MAKNSPNKPTGFLLSGVALAAGAGVGVAIPVDAPMTGAVAGVETDEAPAEVIDWLAVGELGSTLAILMAEGVLVATLISDVALAATAGALDAAAN